MPGKAGVKLPDLLIDRLEAFRLTLDLADPPLHRCGGRSKAGDGVAIGVQDILELGEVIASILQVGELGIEGDAQRLGGFVALVDALLRQLGALPEVLDDPFDLGGEVVHALLDQIEATVTLVIEPDQVDDDQCDQKE